jgi:hypothetical protein
MFFAIYIGVITGFFSFITLSALLINHIYLTNLKNKRVTEASECPMLDPHSLGNHELSNSYKDSVLEDGDDLLLYVESNNSSREVSTNVNRLSPIQIIVSHADDDVNVPLCSPPSYAR